MFNFQGSELVIILLLALVVLGPEKLPDAIRQMGKAYSELRRMSSSFQQEFRSVVDEPMREMRETANLVRDAADPRKIMSEAEAEQRVLDVLATFTHFLQDAVPVPHPAGINAEHEAQQWLAVTRGKGNDQAE